MYTVIEKKDTKYSLYLCDGDNRSLVSSDSGYYDELEGLAKSFQSALNIPYNGVTVVKKKKFSLRIEVEAYDEFWARQVAGSLICNGDGELEEV